MADAPDAILVAAAENGTSTKLSAKPRNAGSTWAETKKLPEEALNFVVAELKSMSADAKVELGIQSQKEKILEDVKKLSAQELIEKMKVDTTLAKIVLGK